MQFGLLETPTSASILDKLAYIEQNNLKLRCYFIKENKYNERFIFV